MNAPMLKTALEAGPDKVNIYHYLCFVVVAEELSFTRAARRLQMDQSWLSAKVRRLERCLGLELFQRTTRHVELTDAGLRLIPSARKMAAAFAETMEISSALSHQLEDVLRIGLPPFSFREPRLNELLYAFAAQNPRLRLQTVTNRSSTELAEMLLNGDVDVIFAVWPYPSEALDVETLRDGYCHLVIPIEDPLASLDFLTMADLRGKTIVTFPEKTNPRLHAFGYGPLRTAGAILKSAPENDQTILLRYASQIGAYAATHPKDASSLHGSVVRKVVDSPNLQRTLARRAGACASAVNRFWDLATHRLKAHSRDVRRAMQLDEANAA